MKNYPNLQVYIIYKTNQKMENTNKHPEIQAAEIVANSNFEIAHAIETLNTGQVYGDSIIDSLGCIAESLRILSGRQVLPEDYKPWKTFK